MRPFKLSNPLRKLTGNYPEALCLRETAKAGGEISKAAIARVWLSEGIPFAFRHCPGMYDIVRAWIGYRLGVDPKEVSITGSARIGQSLAPGKIGKPFDNHSDLDLFVVSKCLFEKMKNDFCTWSYDFENRRIVPENDRERKFWLDNHERGLKVIRKGFLDSKMIPNRKKYSTIQNVHQTMWLLREKLHITDGAPKVKRASLRCYNSWPDHLRQVSLSLKL